MKKFLLCAVFIAASFTSIAQVGFGTTTPDASAALDIESTTKGLLLPRLTKEQRNDINTNAASAGLIIFCTDCSIYGEISFYNGANWSGVSKLVLPTTTVNSGDGTFLTFKNHNLGADTSLNPHVPVKGLNGDYYQWGKNSPDATVDGYTAGSWGAAEGNTNNDNWLPDGKGLQDPCPDGYRVPSILEWKAVVDNNNPVRTGSWLAGDANFGNALHYGSDAVPKNLTLPAAGYRMSSDSGKVYERGSIGNYWSSSEASIITRSSVFTSSESEVLVFSQDGILTDLSALRVDGLSVRCIAQ